MKFLPTYLPVVLGASLLGFQLTGNVLFAEDARAEGPSQKVGRLADGRPYRIDQNGMQLADYVAELEVTKGDLERQIRALEDELIEKNSTIDHLTKGTPLPKAAGRAPEMAAQQNTQLHSQLNSTSAALSSCQSALSQATTRANQLQLQAQQPVSRCNYESAENPYRQEVARLQSALHEAPQKLEAAQAERQESEEQLQTAKQKVSSQATKLSDQEEKLAAQEETISKLQQQLADAQAAATKTSRASLAAAKPSDEATAAEVVASNKLASRAPSSSATSLSSPRPSVEALASARSELRSELQKIQELINQRKSLLDSAGRRGPGVSIKVQPLVSKEGISLDNLRLSVDRLNADSDIDAIRKGLGDIHALLSEDIGVLSRIGKL